HVREFATDRIIAEDVLLDVNGALGAANRIEPGREVLARVAQHANGIAVDAWRVGRALQRHVGKAQARGQVPRGAGAADGNGWLHDGAGAPLRLGGDLRRGGGVAIAARRVGLEQLAQLRRGFLGRLQQLLVVVVHGILAFELLPIMALEKLDSAMRILTIEPETQQRLLGNDKARRERLPLDHLDPDVTQGEEMLAIAGASENRHLWKM